MIKYAVSALVAVIALLGGFYGGFRVGQNNASANGPTASSNNAASNGGNFAGRNPCSTSSTTRNGQTTNRAATFGQITAVVGNVLTIHNPTCNTDTKVTLSSTALIRKTVDGSASDLTNGTNVTINGTKNSDGTVTANNVSILPAGQSFPTQGGGGNRPNGGGGGGGGGLFFGGGG